MTGTDVLSSYVSQPAVGSYDYRETLIASERVNWRIDEIIGGDKKLDFSKRFMPEALARVEELDAGQAWRRLQKADRRGRADFCLMAG